MDPRDTAPDSWEQEDDGEAAVDVELSAFSSLNVNAKPFVPNINAAEFVPSFAQRGPTENPDSGGKFVVTLCDLVLSLAHSQLAS